MEYWTAISIGLLGSLHCIGMCGPIALALPLDRSSSFKIVGGSVIYNLGRLFSYLLIGALLGLVGNGFAMAGFQQILSIVVGSFMVLSAIWAVFQLKKWNFQIHNLWISRIKSAMAKRFRRTSFANLFFIGMLNGILPCGLVYIALAGAIAMASPTQGAFFMFAFGLGTMPLMLAVAVYGNQIKNKFFPPIKRFVPVFIFLIGTLFIIRGMNLGIPYLSPQTQHKQTINCH
ncbi:MAG: sulfite exporter TauE/SafE family protein [Flavobacteriales bacterium]|nr:sulfite exporter TauE/SafE family protein [Flavobacteriales bacterium]